MTMPSGGASCRDVEDYYFDLLANDAVVPEAIRHHAADCPLCRRQIGRLRRLISEAEGVDGPSCPPVSGAVEALDRQFAWLNQQVTCSHVKPFLPECLLTSHEIRIPTPITVHVDHCPQCAADLASLRRQDLTGDQLRRLSRLYRHASGSRPTECLRAQPTAASLATLSLTNADSEALNHVSVCAKCRARIYHGRESAENPLHAGSSPDQTPPCDDIRAADLFDWVVPYGLEAPGIETAAESHEALAAHVRSCPRCMQKLQSLHRIIYGIAERADSPVCTVYHAREDAENDREHDRSTPGRYPIDVQVLHRKRVGILSGRTAAASAAILSRKPLTRGAVTVTAVAVLLASYFAIAPRAAGTDVRELLKPLEGVENVRITTRMGEAGDPIQEIWVARDLNLLMIGTGSTHTLYEFDSRRKRSVQAGAPAGEPVRLSRREYENARRRMTDCVRMVLLSVPGSSKVHPAVEESTSPAEGRSVVYEAAWPMHENGEPAFQYRLRVLIAPRTELPQRIEFLQTGGSGDGWELRTTKTFEYPTETAMKEAVRALFPLE